MAKISKEQRDMIVSEYFAELGRKNGSAGGKQAAKNMTPAARKARGKNAIAARWAKKKS